MDPDELMSRKFKQEFRKQIDLVKNNTDGQLFTYAAALNVIAKRLISNPNSKPILTTWKELIQSVLQSLLNIKQQPSQNALQKFVKMLRPWIENKSYISDVRDNINILYNLSLNGAWTQPCFQCLIKEEDVNLSELANCLEYEDPAVVVKRLQGLNLNLLKKSAWNLIRAALLKQKFKSNRTFQNAYQIQVVFNIAEPDIIEECKNFEFSVTLETLPNLQTFVDKIKVNLHQKLISKFQNEGDIEKMLLLCNSALLYMWKSDTVITATEMTAKWCEIKLGEFKDKEKFIVYVRNHILSGDNGPSTVTHCLILMQSIWERVKDSSRYICVDILMRAIHLLEKEEDPEHQNKIEILETIANLLSKFIVSKLCLLSVFFLEPCVETYLKVARKFRSDSPAELQQERQELQDKLCIYLKKHFLSGHHTDAVEWSAIRRECLSKLSLEDASLVDKEESLLNDGKMSDDTDSSPQQSPDAGASQLSVGPCAICSNDHLCPNCQAKSNQVNKRTKSFKYGWSCPVITCTVCSCRMTFICQHLSTKHGWEEEEIGAFTKSLGVTKNAIWTSQIDDLTPYAEGNKDESVLTEEEESSISPSSSAGSSPRNNKSELLGSIKPNNQKVTMEHSSKAEKDLPTDVETPEKVDIDAASHVEESAVRNEYDKKELNKDDDDDEVIVKNPDTGNSNLHNATPSLVTEESTSQDDEETKDGVSESQEDVEMQQSQGVEEIQSKRDQAEEDKVIETQRGVEDNELQEEREMAIGKSPEKEKCDISVLEKVEIEPEMINSPAQEPDVVMETEATELQNCEPEVDDNTLIDHDTTKSSPGRNIHSDISEDDKNRHSPTRDLLAISQMEESSSPADNERNPSYSSGEKVEKIEFHPGVKDTANEPGSETDGDVSTVPIVTLDEIPEEFDEDVQKKRSEIRTSDDDSDDSDSADDDDQPPSTRKDIGLVPYSDQSSESISDAMSPSTTSQDSKMEFVPKSSNMEGGKVSVSEIPPLNQTSDSHPVHTLLAATPEPVTLDTTTNVESRLDCLLKSTKKKSIAGFYCPVPDCGRVFMHKHTIIAHIKFRHKLNNKEATEMAEKAESVSPNKREVPKNEREDLNKILCSRGWYLKIDAYIYEDEIDEVLVSTPVQGVRHGIVECVRQLFEHPPSNFNYNLASKYLESYWPLLGSCTTQASPEVDDFSDVSSMIEATYSNLEDDANLSQSSQEVDTGFLQSSHGEAPISEERKDDAKNFAESAEPIPVKKETKNKLTQTNGAKGQIMSISDHIIVPTSQGKLKKHHPERSKYNPSPTVMSGMAFGKTTTRTLAIQVCLPKPYKQNTVGNSKVAYGVPGTHSKKFKIKPKKPPVPASKAISTNSKNNNAKSPEIVQTGKSRDMSLRSPAMALKQHPKQQMSFEEALTEPNRLILDGKSRNRLSHKNSSTQDTIGSFLPLVDSSLSPIKHSPDRESKIKKKRSISVDSGSVRDQTKLRKLSHSTERQPDRDKQFRKDYGAKKKHTKALKPKKYTVTPSPCNPDEIASLNDVSPQKASNYYDLLQQAQQISGNGDAAVHESASVTKKMVKDHNTAQLQSTERSSNDKKVRYLKKKRSISLRRLSSISTNEEEGKTETKQYKKIRREEHVTLSKADNDQEYLVNDSSRKCSICGRVMANDFALACHMRKKHKSKSKMFIPGQTSMSAFIDDPPDKEKRQKSKMSSTSSDESSVVKRRTSTKTNKTNNKSKVSKNVEPVHTENASLDAPCAQANDHGPDGVSIHFQSLLNALPDTLNEIFYCESYRDGAHEKLKNATCKLSTIERAISVLFSFGLNLYLCPYPGCGQPCRKIVLLRNHLFDAHFLDLNELVKKTLTLVEGENISLCYECNKKFSKLKDLQSHARRHHFKFIDRAEPMNLTMKQKATLIKMLSDETFHCTLCRHVSFTTLQALMAHVRMAHNLTKKEMEKNRMLQEVLDLAARELLDGCMLYWPSQDNSYSNMETSDEMVADSSVDAGDLSFDGSEEDQTTDWLDSAYEDEMVSEKLHTEYQQSAEIHPVNETDASEICSCEQFSHDKDVCFYETSCSDADIDTLIESCSSSLEDSFITMEIKTNRATQLRRLAYTKAVRKIAMKTPEHIQRKKWAEFQNLAYLYNKRALRKISRALSPGRKLKVTSRQAPRTTSLQCSENDYERRCWLCKDVFRKNSNYSSHILYHLRSIDRYPNKCDFPGCLFGFPSYFDLANHKRLHNDGFHVCVFCNDQIEPIKSTQDLFVHEKIHHNSSVKSLARLRNWFCLRNFENCKEETRLDLLHADLDGNSVDLNERDCNDPMKNFLWYHQRSSHQGFMQNMNEVFQTERRPQFNECQFEADAETKDINQKVHAIVIDILDTLEEAEQQVSNHGTNERTGQMPRTDLSENSRGNLDEKMDCYTHTTSEDCVGETISSSQLAGEINQSSGCFGGSMRKVQQDNPANFRSHISAQEKVFELNGVTNGNVFEESVHQNCRNVKRCLNTGFGACSDCDTGVEMLFEKGENPVVKQALEHSNVPIHSNVTLQYDSVEDQDCPARECKKTNAMVPYMHETASSSRCQRHEVVSNIISDDSDQNKNVEEKNSSSMLKESKTTETDYENLFDRYREEMQRHIENGCDSPEIVLLHENPMESLCKSSVENLSENQNQVTLCPEDQNTSVVRKDEKECLYEKTSTSEDFRTAGVCDSDFCLTTMHEDTTRARVKSVLSKLCSGNFCEQDLTILEISSLMERMLSHVECVVQCAELGDGGAEKFLGVLQLDCTNSSKTEMTVLCSESDLAPSHNTGEQVREVNFFSPQQSVTVKTVESIHVNHQKEKYPFLKEEHICETGCMDNSVRLADKDFNFAGLQVDHRCVKTSEVPCTQSEQSKGNSLIHETGSIITCYNSIHGKLTREQVEKRMQIVDIDIDKPSAVMEPENSADMPIPSSTQPRKSQSLHAVTRSCEQECYNFTKDLLDDFYESIRNCSDAIKQGKKKKQKTMYNDPFRRNSGRPIKHAEQTEPVIPEKWHTDDKHVVNMFPSMFEKRKLNPKTINQCLDKGRIKKHSKQSRKIVTEEISSSNSTDVICNSLDTVPNGTASSAESQLFNMFCIADVAKCRSRGRNNDMAGQPMKKMKVGKRKSVRDKACSERREKKGDKIKSHSNGTHQELETLPNVSLSNKRMSASNDSRIPCGACLKMISKVYYLDHLMDHILHPKHRFFCSFPHNRCIYSSRTKKSLDEHSKRHARSKPYLCMFCKDSYKTMVRLEDHQSMAHRAIKSRFLREIADRRKKILSITPPVPARARVDLSSTSTTLDSSAAETETVNGEIISELPVKVEDHVQKFNVVENDDCYDDEFNNSIEKPHTSRMLVSRTNDVPASMTTAGNSPVVTLKEFQGVKRQTEESSENSRGREKTPISSLYYSNLFAAILEETQKNKKADMNCQESVTTITQLPMSIACHPDSHKSSESSMLANTVSEFGIEKSVVTPSEVIPHGRMIELGTSEYRSSTTATDMLNAIQRRSPASFAYKKVSIIARKPKVLVEKISATSKPLTERLSVFKIPVGRFTQSSMKESSCSTSVIFTSRASGSFPLPAVSTFRSLYQPGTSGNSDIRRIDRNKEYTSLTASALSQQVRTTLSSYGARSHTIYSANSNMTAIPSKTFSPPHNNIDLTTVRPTIPRLVLLEPRTSKKVQIVRPVIRSEKSFKPNVSIRQKVDRPHFQVQHSERDTALHTNRSAPYQTYSRNLPPINEILSKRHLNYPIMLTQAQASVTMPNVSSDLEVISESKSSQSNTCRIKMACPVETINRSSNTLAIPREPIAKLDMANTVDLCTEPPNRSVLSFSDGRKSGNETEVNVVTIDLLGQTNAITNRCIEKKKLARSTSLPPAPPCAPIVLFPAKQEGKKRDNVANPNPSTIQTPFAKPHSTNGFAFLNRNTLFSPAKQDGEKSNERGNSYNATTDKEKKVSADSPSHNPRQEICSSKHELQQSEHATLLQSDKMPLKTACYILGCNESFASSAELIMHLKEIHLLFAEREISHQSCESERMYSNSTAGNEKIDSDFINQDIQATVWKIQKFKLHNRSRITRLYLVDTRVSSLQMAIEVYIDVKAFVMNTRPISLKKVHTPPVNREISRDFSEYRCRIAKCNAALESKKKFYNHFFKDHTITEIILFLRQRHKKNQRRKITHDKRKSRTKKTSLCTDQSSVKKACRFKGCPAVFTRESMLTDSEALTEEIKAHMNVHYRDSVQLARFGSAIMPLFNSFVSLEGLSKDLVSASGCKIDQLPHTVICCNDSTNPNKTEEIIHDLDKFVSDTKEVVRSRCENRSPDASKLQSSKVSITRKYRETVSQPLTDETHATVVVSCQDPLLDQQKANASTKQTFPSKIISVKLPILKVTLLKNGNGQIQDDVMLKRPATLMTAENEIASPKVPRIMLKKLGS